MKKSILILLVFAFFGCQEKENTQLFIRAFKAAQQKDYFTTKALFDASKESVSTAQFHILQAITANAFNQIELSEESINVFLRNHSASAPDSINQMIWDIRHDNAYKKYQYKEAKESVQYLLTHYTSSLSQEEIDDYENSLKLWTILEDQPAQQIIIESGVEIQMSRDLAGLRNLPITSGSDTTNFIFDTGANLSTVTRSSAEKLQMTILEDSILVGTITGDRVYAQLAICPEFFLDQIVVKNAVFIVFDDDKLAFPQINYQIHGIIGFPVMEALDEIRISQSDLFTANTSSDELQPSQNLALDHLNPIIHVDGKHYSFDTGADETMLFKRYYEENKESIASSSTLTDIQFGGAGGQTNQTGYRIKFTASISGRTLELNNIPVLREEISQKWNGLYGNIGQDVIHHFDVMTLNFRDMYIKFD